MKHLLPVCLIATVHKVQLLSLLLLLLLLLGLIFVIKMAWINKIGPKTEAKHISQISTNSGQPLLFS